MKTKHLVMIQIHIHNMTKKQKNTIPLPFKHYSWGKMLKCNSSQTTYKRQINFISNFPFLGHYYPFPNYRTTKLINSKNTQYNPQYSGIRQQIAIPTRKTHGQCQNYSVAPNPSVK